MYLLCVFILQNNCDTDTTEVIRVRLVVWVGLRGQQCIDVITEINDSCNYMLVFFKHKYNVKCMCQMYVLNGRHKKLYLMLD